MHAHITVDGKPIMLSDGRCTGKPVFQGFSLSLTCKSDAEAEKIFKALGEGGQQQMPMTTTFFASRFGMVADKFGVGWMVLAEAEKKARGNRMTERNDQAGAAVLVTPDMARLRAR